ncbi:MULTISPECIES: hypothetical protein [Streptomyces]|uniref:hypothetical protein n=1 Tax=Streptomyces TaxID=1883 RepID=UPI0015CF1391|nr:MULTISPECIES: hypothetical protein [Streptomyces]MDX2552910.1 hypothetical protein [Streptomyces stelliscabiei]MDX2613769.1 hypothetical protein [Streptomyces stelliscabiei]MDX2638112.1 hypothetical protein [Streptomyces stelliscabiei]MDX2661545.1 hypothetical protein [Streptomyces stelliscabiei]MDX2713010.1 hypothetical protein [Streptomyces stelliscabiei]
MRRRIQIVGDIESADIRSALRPGQVEKIVVRDNRVLGNLDFLVEPDTLNHLDISGGTPYLHDLTPLRELPLAWLSMNSLPALEKPGALHPLGASATLRALDTAVPLCTESVDEALPRNLPLEYLRFTRDALRFTGLRGLRHMRSVKRLSLAKLPERLTPDDFEEIARLPALEELRLHRNATGWAAGPVLPHITGLALNAVTGAEDLSGIPELFPGLRTVSIHLAPDVSDVPEHLLEHLPGPPTVQRTRTVL